MVYVSFIDEVMESPCEWEFLPSIMIDEAPSAVTFEIQKLVEKANE